MYKSNIKLSLAWEQSVNKYSLAVILYKTSLHHYGTNGSLQIQETVYFKFL